MATKTLRVLPNPWQHIHEYADGVPRPCSAVHVDMVEHVPQPGRYVGATIEKAVETQKQVRQQVGKHSVEHKPAAHDLYWSFATEPVTIPNTGYYRDAIKADSLIAADEATALAAGVKFRDPAEALRAARDKGVAHFDSYHGPGAFDAAQPKPEAAPAAPEPPPPEKPAASKRSAKD